MKKLKVSDITIRYNRMKRKHLIKNLKRTELMKIKEVMEILGVSNYLTLESMDGNKDDMEEMMKKFMLEEGYEIVDLIQRRWNYCYGEYRFGNYDKVGKRENEQRRKESLKEKRNNPNSLVNVRNRMMCKTNNIGNK